VSIVAIFLDTSLFLYISRLKMNKLKDTIVMINTFRDWNLHSASEKVEDGNGNEKKTGADCWEDGDFIGKDECDTHGLPLCSEVETGNCFDEADYPDTEENNNGGDDGGDGDTVGEADLPGCKDVALTDYDGLCMSESGYSMPLCSVMEDQGKNVGCWDDED
jgi:hypothetical protein